MILNSDFNDPLEFARLMQQNQELRDFIKACIKFRYFLASNHALDGFKTTISGFDIEVKS